MIDSMNTSTVENALRRLGEVLSYDLDIEILLVGGAAGMVTGVLSSTRTTLDCDVMVYNPPEAMSAVESAAQEVATELELPSNWLNSDVQFVCDYLDSLVGKGTKAQQIDDARALLASFEVDDHA
jgi:hypothetical protein